ncbi:MAG TPA: O-antigen ligase family protein [Chitinophagaceae bacterium]|nr:O-antigen ligase family protein [Chitinophagaceae bacterium]
MNRNIGFIHYYWLANGLFLLTVFHWMSPVIFNGIQNSLNTNQKKINYLYAGIAGISLVESLIVTFQFVGFFPVPNNNFLCTGTWINPNVTAIFLSLSLYATLVLKRSFYKPWQKMLGTSALFIICIAILLLMCRTAYLVTCIFLLFEYYPRLQQYIKHKLRFSTRGFAFLLSAFIVCWIFISLFSFKEGSTKGRLQIWETSVELFRNNPLFGYGFGTFEKEYNIYAVNKSYATNDYINTAYNDFLEMGVEGGIVAMLIWIVFLALLFKEAYINRKLHPQVLPLLIGFTVIQLTNFGFQAIPGMVLFVIYIGTLFYETENTFKQADNAPWVRRWYKLPAIGLSLFLLIQVSALCSAFYSKWMLGMQNGPVQISKFFDLQTTLNGYALFHESFGDAYLRQKNIPSAFSQYHMAIRNSSNPDLYAKLGLCAQLLNKYDSSEYYFSIVKKMQPHKFLPRYALLKLYQQSKDTIKEMELAKEIVQMPTKIRNKKTDQIKAYATSIIRKEHDNHINTFNK